MQGVWVAFLFSQGASSVKSQMSWSKWGASETPIAMSGMPPVTDPNGPAKARPPSIPCPLLFYAPTLVQTLAPMVMSAFRLSLSMRHTVVPQKSTSNPAFPCSASRIKAFPSLPMKLLNSLYRDADRKVVHTGGILPHWQSASQGAVTNQVLFLGDKRTRFSSARR